ncbi:MFS transporter [Nocardia huaxiensis]|uniref:MFS transporter n=1 Tax=Nocardia huaxiensis TaxID=2755382 RepID=A0A7D6ZMJ6_9NOCA|nr:MFS transporter [Nocardia huaxiensis]QLY33240.1 MFS transporter [Nocardia huaxiensis]UFS99826.1 MFS transporter [Nocardia huaxiensis]
MTAQPLARATAVDTGTRSHERRITLALFAAGLTTFASMYSAQALLPSLSAAFGAEPARAALAVSLTTGLLAVAIIPVSALSNRFGRTRVMTASALTTCAIGLLLPLSPSLDVLLAGRALQGVALAGVPAVAMAYLAEEIGAAGLGTAMGVYISGTTLGGLAGRLIPAVTLGTASWRWAAAAIAVAAALCTLWFVRTVPASRRFTASSVHIRTLAADLADHLRDRTLLPLFGLAFLLAGGFTAIYNFLGFRLTAAPFELSPAAAGSVFVMYLAGTVSATVSGRLSGRFGRTRVVTAAILTMAAGLLLTIPDRLPTLLLGVLLCTAGFFGAHAVAGGWVGATATKNRAAASSLYLFAYYLGNSVLGGAAGLAFGHGGWTTLTIYVAVLVLAAAALIGMRSARSSPAEAQAPTA